MKFLLFLDESSLIHEQCQNLDGKDVLCYVIVFVWNLVFNSEAECNQEAHGQDYGRVMSFPVRMQVRTGTLM
jgi:hypothetical protein